MNMLRTTSTLADERRRTLMLAIGAFILVLICWQTGALETLLYPMRLFVSLVHELGHGLTAILTGGRFIRFEVYPNGAGLATTAGGSPFLVPQMGYLGAALFGALLLAATNRVRAVRYVAYGVAMVIGGGVLLFAASAGWLLVGLLVVAGAAWLVADRFKAYRTLLRLVAAGLGIISIGLIGSDTALRIGLIGAALLAALGTLAPRPVTIFVLNFLALTVGLNAILDIWGLLGDLNASLGVVPNDAAAMARFTGIPTVFWVLLWAVLAVVMMGTAAYIAFIQPRRGPKNLP